MVWFLTQFSLQTTVKSNLAHELVKLLLTICRSLYQHAIWVQLMYNLTVNNLDVSQNNTYVNDHFVFEAACKIVQDTIKHSQAEQRKYGEKEKTK